jgi:hypothetical protein
MLAVRAFCREVIFVSNLLSSIFKKSRWCSRGSASIPPDETIIFSHFISP